MPALTSEWIKAIVTAAFVGLIAGLIASLLRRGFDLTSPEARLPATLLLFATEIAAGVPSFAVYANRTGAVLQSKLPAFPALTWSVLHVLAGVVVGTIVAITEMGTGADVPSEPTTSELGTLVIGGAAAGALLGAAAGALQALVIRKAAREVSPWIQWSAIGGTALALYVPVLLIPGDQTLASELLGNGLGFIIAVISGAALLPALHRLEPR